MVLPSDGRILAITIDRRDLSWLLWIRFVRRLRYSSQYVEDGCVMATRRSLTFVGSTANLLRVSAFAKVGPPFCVFMPFDWVVSGIATPTTVSMGCSILSAGLPILSFPFVNISGASVPPFRLARVLFTTIGVLCSASCFCKLLRNLISYDQVDFVLSGTPHRKSVQISFKSRIARKKGVKHYTFQNPDLEESRYDSAPSIVESGSLL